MNKLLIISIIAYILLAICMFFIIIMVIRKGNLYKKLSKKYIKVILLINLGLYFTSYILTFSANIFINLNNLPPFTLFFKSFFEAFDLYAFSYIDNLLELIKQENGIYISIACTITGIAGISGIILLLFNSLIIGTINKLKIRSIKNKEHYIIIGKVDDIKQYSFDFGKDKKIIVIFDINNAKVDSDNYGKPIFKIIKDYFFNNDRKKIVNNSERKYNYIFDTDIQSVLIKAGIKTNNVTVISFYDENETKELEGICNQYLSENSVLYLKDYNVEGNSFEKTAKYRIKLFCIEDMISKNFIFNYPLYQYLPDTMINRDTGYFDKELSFIFISNDNKIVPLIKNIEMYYQGYHNTFTASVISDASIDEEIIAMHSNNNRIKEECKGNPKYYDVACINTTLDDKNHYYKLDGDYIENVKKNLKDFTFIFIDNLEDDKCETLFKYLDNENKDYVIFVNDQRHYHSNSKKIVKICLDEKRLINQFILDNEIEQIGIEIRKLKHPDIIFDPLADNYNDRESRRVATLGINIKLSLLGYELGKDSLNDCSEEFTQKYNLNFDKWRKYNNYDYSCTRVNLGLIEKFRWNANEILIKQTMPLCKDEILVKEAEGPTKFFNRVNGKHACLLTIKGLFELEKDVFDAYSNDVNNKIDPKIKVKDYQQFEKDWGTMDKLLEGIKGTGYYINKCKPFK